VQYVSTNDDYGMRILCRM